MSIDDLKLHEETILLAEIGALIHDVGKLSKLFVDKKSIEGEKNPKYEDYHHGNILEYDSNPQSKYYPKDPVLENSAKKLKIILEKLYMTYGEKSDLYKLMKRHHLGNSNSFVRLITACDRFDSEEDRKDAGDRQPIRRPYFSNAFGYEKELPLISEIDFNNERKAVYDLIIEVLDDFNTKNVIQKRINFLEKLKYSFSKTLGMTARAANDVSLWEHSYMCASQMKALICESIMKGNPLIQNKEDIRKKEPFRILSITLDFFEFVSQSHKIPDVVGRIIVLDEAKQKIRNLIEMEYLLGNCIYEDEYGLHFLVPASFDLADIIKEQIYRIFNEDLEGIITPQIHLTNNGAYLSELLPSSIKEMNKNKETDFKPGWMNNWKGSLTKRELVCNICGKGVYYEGDKEEICVICRKLRDNGRKQEDTQTIFIDEIAWNGKNYENVALFVLDFDLDNWLNGEYVNTLFFNRAIEEKDLIAIEGKIRHVIQFIVGPLIRDSKIPSKENIESIRNEIELKLGEYQILGDKCEIVQEIVEKIDNISANEINDRIRQILNDILSKYKYLDKNLGSSKNPSPSRLMRVWNNTREFFEDLDKTICEISCIVKRPIIEIKDLSSSPDKKAYELNIESNSEEIDAEGFFEDGNLIIVTPHANSFVEKTEKMKITVTDELWQIPTQSYICEFKNRHKPFRSYRAISISPKMFMFLVSASKTPEILKEIRKRYMNFFGKVYGKLPLHMSIIYFKRKTPFYAILDSAKRFLRCAKNEYLNKEFKVKVKNDPEISDTVKIETDIGKLQIPIKLGNGETDYYHPYLMVENGEESIEIGCYKEKHARTLRKSDNIKIHPSFFDFIFLDSNIRRFDVHLKDGKRPHSLFERELRPYYIEDIDKFYEIWDILERNCDNTQLNNFESLLLSKIREWKLRNLEDFCNEEFEKLTRASIRNVLGINRGSPDFEIIFQSVVSGIFFDVKELNHTILKRTLGGRENE